MDILLCGNFDADERQSWQQALAQALPEGRWLDLDEARAQPAAVQAAVVANPPPGSLQGLPALRLIQSLWAGVDRLLADATLPPGVPIARMVDPAMSAAMAQTALWATLALQRGFFGYARQQRQRLWRQHGQRRADECPVLVLGQGEIGGAVAQALARTGFPVTGWSRRAGEARGGVRRVAGAAALWQELPGAQVLVNLLPLTEATAGILDARLFAALPHGAGLVNLARGRHVVDADLLAALDRSQVGHAVLDVFHPEPLPPEHPFWTHERVTVLPHVAAQTDERSAAAVVAANLRALREGREPRHRVDRRTGY